MASFRYRHSTSGRPGGSFRFRSKATNCPQFGFEDDESSDEEFDGHQTPPPMACLIKPLLMLLLFASAFLLTLVLHNEMLLSNFNHTKEDVRRAGRGIWDQAFSSYEYVQRLAYSKPHGSQVDGRTRSDNPSGPELARAVAQWDSRAAPVEIAQLETVVVPAHSTHIYIHEEPGPDSIDGILKDLDQRIDAALIRRSTNSVSQRDFALNADYIPKLTSSTSSTLDTRQKRGLRTMNLLLGFDVGRSFGNTPPAALTDGGDDEQSCWAFPGSAGYLGILLNDRISVEGVTLEHLPRNILSDSAIFRAPRKVVLWGLVEGPHNLSKEKLYRDSGYIEKGPMAGIIAQSSFLPTQETGSYIPLAVFEYKLSGKPRSHIQTKKVSQTLQSFQMDFQTVVLEVLSNWGGESTCLYRVQVHGSPLKGVGFPVRKI